MGTLWKPVAIVVGLLALLTYLLVLSRSLDAELTARVQSALQTVQLHDTELTRDILLARAGLLPNYDPLAQTGGELLRAVESVRRQIGALSANTRTAAFELRSNMLASTLRHKLRLVEYFKSDQALLRNSLAYFSHAGPRMSPRIEDEKIVAAQINALSRAMLRFMQAPDPSAAQVTRAVLERLENGPDAQSLRSLVAHGRLMLAVLPRVDTMLRQIIALPTVPHVNALQAAVLRYSDRIEARARTARFLLYLVAVVLLAYVVYQFRRLRASEEHFREVLEAKVSERTQQLEEANVKLEAASRHKSQFLAHMSHELRTPLNGILGYAQILRKDNALTTKQRNGLEIIHESGEHLLGLINEILDLSRIESHRLEINLAAFSLVDLLDSIEGMFEAKAQRRNLQFRLAIVADLPVVVQGDKQKLNQILLNLIDNAIKFTERGEVVVSVRRDGERVCFAVNDTGCGIKAADIERIFQPFQQVGEHARVTEGTGLGLAISRTMVELLGGKLEVQSEFGKGSRFWFSISLPESNAILLRTAPECCVLGYQGARRRVLVVDDLEVNRAVLRDMGSRPPAASARLTRSRRSSSFRSPRAPTRTTAASAWRRAPMIFCPNRSDKRPCWNCCVRTWVLSLSTRPRPRRHRLR